MVSFASKCNFCHFFLIIHPRKVYFLTLCLCMYIQTKNDPGILGSSAVKDTTHLPEISPSFVHALQDIAMKVHYALCVTGRVYLIQLKSALMQQNKKKLWDTGIIEGTLATVK